MHSPDLPEAAPSAPPTQPPVDNPPSSPTPPTPPAPPSMPDITEYHRDMYPSVASEVSYSDVTALAYEASFQQFSYGEDSLQTLEYWEAQSIAQREGLPTIVFIHGGCWLNGFRINQSYPLATALSKNGFPVWSVEYRAVGDQGGGWPGSYNDVEAAISYISSQAEQLYSARPLLVIGHSAGGHLGFLASAKMNDSFDTVGLAAIVDIIAYANSSSPCSSSVVTFMNGRFDDLANEYFTANPELSSLAGEAYLFIGGKDTIVPSSQAINSGLPTELVEQAGHFDWIHPGTEGFSRLLAFLLAY